MATMPPNYFNRFSPAQNYHEHLFIAGRGLQSAELNEIQTRSKTNLRGVADAIFKDGDVIRDAGCVVDPTTGVTQCEAGAVYIAGLVRGVLPATFTIPIVGEVAIGIRLVETVITSNEDVSLLDPATGTRNFNRPGADRLRVVASWGWDGDGGSGEFFPVYGVVDGVLRPKEPPPTTDAVSQALARYDRDSAGGTYIVSGLDVTQLPDSGGNQVYSVAEGRARVFGFGIEFTTARRVVHAAVPDLKAIVNEPHLSTTVGAQRIDFNRAPGTGITAVSITAQKTVTLTHGAFSGVSDPLPDNSVLQIMSVVQGGTTYTPTTDYVLNDDQVDWSPGGAEPAPGSTYNVTYRYVTLVTPTAIDDDGFTVTGAVVGTQVLVSYSQKLPRYDRLGITADGDIVWLIGVAASYNPQPPAMPLDVLSVATVHQTWRDATRTVTNDGVRVVTMPKLARVENRLDYLVQLIAQQRLESSVHTREAGVKKGLFTDPFLDDSMRDAGTAQTAAIVDGELMLSIASSVHQMPADVEKPTAMLYTNVVRLSQELRSGSMKINPYMAFDIPAAKMVLDPAVDRWTVLQTNWLSQVTSFWRRSDWRTTKRVTTSRDALINTTTTRIETLRPITVSFQASGFGPGENLQSLTFDGIPITMPPTSSNGSGVMTGSFTIPSGLPSGSKLVRLVGAGGSVAQAVFTGQGTLTVETWQRQVSITVGTRRVDPLAQTFTLDANAQVTGVDLPFAAAPTTRAFVQIRETAVGFPTGTVIAEATLDPSQVLAAPAYTRALFDAPVALLGGVEYAIVVLCNDATGALAIAELGKFDSIQQRWITSQPYNVGVLLSSSNASTWTAHQDRDMAFKLLSPDFTQTSRTIDLGDVAVAGATDLALLAYTEAPASDAVVEFTLTLPDGTQIAASDGQPIQLAAPITGDVNVSARLSGGDVSPILFPGTQLIAGTLASAGDYVSRAVPAGTGVTVKLIYEAILPSGATLTARYKGPDIGDTWSAPIPVSTTSPGDDGWVEFVHQVTGVNETSVQVKLELTGTPAARPRVRDLRVIVIAP